MRMLPICAMVLVAVAWSPAADANQKRKRTAETAHARAVAPVGRKFDDRDRWYPNDANQLRIGSQIWWDQMAREGRLGKPSP